MPSRSAVALTSAVLAGACRTKAAPAPDPVEPPGACIGRGGEPAKPGTRNVLGTELQACPSRSMTGFYRDGYCSTGEADTGVHVVCATVTDAFLRFSAAHGNDLITPRGEFSGLRDGDAWCLCAARFREALDAGVAPPVIVEATDEAALHLMKPSELTARSTEMCRAPR